MALNLESLSEALQKTSLNQSGVSFAAKCLKLDSENDARLIVEAIEKCQDLHFLNLEGNTLGVDAAKAIAKALEKHPEMKRALWKDLFTGRLKTEIPEALKFLGDGLVAAGAKLTELDLSDNAFGPIGVQGLAALLRSSSCYALEELKLNNNGLGIGGGKLLASALLDCYNSSKSQGKPLALRVFIAGRNRLENEGAKALSEVFKTIGTLREIAMPQNGIYHIGISALSQAFKMNKNLEILNLNDNTIGPKGANSIAEVLPELQELKEINFGDCLLKTNGAKSLAYSLSQIKKLETLTLTFNEIKTEGAIELAKAMKNKNKLKEFSLDGNAIGEVGIEVIEELLKSFGNFNALGSLEEDEGCDSGDGESEGEEEEETESEEESFDVTVERNNGNTSLNDRAHKSLNEKLAEKVIDRVKENHNETFNQSLNKNANISFNESFNKTIQNIVSPITSCTLTDFMTFPTSEKYLGLGENRDDLLIADFKRNLDSQLDSSMSTLMKITALTASNDEQVAELALKCSEVLYREVFTWAGKTEKLSILNNSLLVNLGMIKSEDKKFKPTWNLEGCLRALETVIKKNYIPETTRNSLKVFIELNHLHNKSGGDAAEAKQRILSILN